MPIPKFTEIMVPPLQILQNGPMPLRDAIEQVSDHFGLSKAEQEELLDSGKQTVIQNRVGWAKSNLARARLIESPMRGVWVTSQRGRELLAEGIGDPGVVG